MLFSSAVLSKIGIRRSQVGGLREVAVFSLPIVLILFAGNAVSFIEKILLARCSLEALESSTMAFFAVRLVQMPCISIAHLSQVFVGKRVGENRLTDIGPCIWQMIWFSFLSVLVTFPLTIGIGKVYLSGLPVEAMGMRYIMIIAAGGFLYPLSLTLSSFYLGQGRARLVLAVMFSAYILNIVLDMLLIFGAPPFIPRMEIAGAALGWIISNSLACLALFFFFIKKTNHAAYATNHWRFCPISCWKCLRVGIPRGFGKIILYGAWMVMIHLLLQREKEHLAMISIGFTIIGFFTFLGDGLQQGVAALAARLFGASSPRAVWKLLRSGLVFAALIGTALMVPFFAFPETIVAVFSLNEGYSDLILQIPQAMIWVWWYIVCYMISCLAFSLIMAAEETTFYLRLIPLSLLVFIPFYLAIHWGNPEPGHLWFFTSLESILFSAAYLWRMRRHIKRKKASYQMELLHE